MVQRRVRVLVLAARRFPGISPQQPVAGFGRWHRPPISRGAVDLDASDCIDAGAGILCQQIAGEWAVLGQMDLVEDVRPRLAPTEANYGPIGLEGHRERVWQIGGEDSDYVVDMESAMLEECVPLTVGPGAEIDDEDAAEDETDEFDFALPDTDDDSDAYDDEDYSESDSY